MELTSFLALFVFLISPMHHYHSALLHCQALILDGGPVVDILMAFTILVLKPHFSQSLSLHSHLPLAEADVL